MIAHSGVDPLGPVANFIKNDPIKNVDVRRDDKSKISYETEK
jgi:hypothetical protein